MCFRINYNFIEYSVCVVNLCLMNFCSRGNIVDLMHVYQGNL